MQDKTVSLTAIVCITLLEAVALFKGIDGTLFAGAVAVIAGISGYHVRKWFGGSNG